MPTAADYKAQLEDCGVSKGDILFVHSSMNWLAEGATDVADVIKKATEIIEALIDTVGNEGTICMPSFIWCNPKSTQPPEGMVLDLKRTPTAVGLLPEIFRRRPGVQRSASYYMPVCAYGAKAHDLLANQSCIIDAYGDGGTFRRVMEAGGKALGLGVALGTSALSHLVERDLAPLCPVKIYSEKLLLGDIIDFDGTRLHTQSLTLHPQVFSHHVPSATFTYSEALRSELIFRKWGNAFVWSHSARTYYEEALAIGGQRLAEGRLPPWASEPRWIPPGG
jgi:aminoglycoside 3-N-acetyltransferase